jgi:hypothetical protein
MTMHFGNIDAAAKAAEDRRSFTSAKLDWLTALSADPRLDARAFQVGFCIVQHMNAQTWRAILSDDVITDKTGIPTRWVSRARQCLREAGWIDWQRTGKANVYRILVGCIAGVTERQIELKEKRAEKRKAGQIKIPEAHDRPRVADIHLQPYTFSVTPSKEHTIPEAQSATGSSGVLEVDQSGNVEALIAESLSKPKGRYQQTREQANAALLLLRRLSFRTEWDDASIALSERSERGVQANWYRLLSSGICAENILDVAERVVSEIPDNQLPSLGGFLARFEGYREVASSSTSPLPMQRAPAIEHHV